MQQHTFSPEAKEIILKKTIENIAEIALETFQQLGCKKEISGTCENEAGERFVFSFAKVVDTPQSGVMEYNKAVAMPDPTGMSHKEAAAAGWVYEDALPELSDELYNVWLACSCIIDGVRMGPRIEDL